MMMVHSKGNQVDFHFLRQVAEEAGVSADLCEKVEQANTASEVGDLMVAAGYGSFFQKLCLHVCENVLQEVGGGMEVETILITMDQRILGRERVAWSPLK
jgi:cobalt-precorrin-5B (C1)-methyltransferase